MQLVHLEPVEDAALDRLDQVARLEPRLLARVAADEARALEHDVVELAAARIVRADCADERPGSQPLPAQHGILRRRRRDDDVQFPRVAMTLARLGPDFLAERLEPFLVSAVRDDAIDRGNRRADRRDLALRLPAAADHPEAARLRPCEIAGRDAARRSRPQLAELVCLDHRDEPWLLGGEETDDERRPAREPRVRLEAGKPEPRVGGGHEREHAVLELDPAPRLELEHAHGLTLERALNRGERVLGRDE